MTDSSVLIVDDEEGIVKLCQRLLERANFSVEGRSNPEEGLDALKNQAFDLLLVDIRMPGMDGFKVIEHAREMQPDIAVVIMTGYGTLETAIQALRRGADGLILKPFEKGEDLVNAVREALKERKQKQEVSRLLAIRPLLNITESLFAETRRQALLDLILNAIIGHLRSNHAAIYQRSPGESRITLVQASGNALPGEDIKNTPGILSRADQWKIPIWVNSQGPGDSDFKQILEENQLSGVVCIPVERGDGDLIFLAARDAGEPGYGLVDIELFGLLARQADVALENARLYEELRDYIRQIEQSQRALIQAEKMSAVGRLTASIAHEVNNPLQAVQNCLHLADREELSQEKRAEYMDMAKEELDRLMNTVQRMLDFYRPGALQKKKADIAQLVEKVLALLEKQLIAADVVVDVALDKNLPEVRVVQNQIQQVFFNLVLNAMDAMKDGGALRIYSQLENGHLAIFFEDNGPGVPAEIRNTIFEPFTSSSEDGTGLGLSVSYGILTAHGGRLELVEEKDQGACFMVVIPLEETE